MMMNPKHVTNLELSKALFEAGITKDFESEFYHVRLGSPQIVTINGVSEEQGEYWEIMTYDEGSGRGKMIPALLLSELLELMPKWTDAELYLEEDPFVKHCWLSGYRDHKEKVLFTIPPDIFPDTPLEAISSLATYLLREGKFNNNAK